MTAETTFLKLMVESTKATMVTEEIEVTASCISVTNQTPIQIALSIDILFLLKIKAIYQFKFLLENG